MIHLNMDVNIDVIADDKWGSSVSWIETKVMRKIEVAMLELFEYPISAGATLEDYNIMTDGEDDEE